MCHIYTLWLCLLFLGDRSPCASGPMSCLSVLSVTLVNCGQAVGWIKIPLGTEVGLGRGDIVLDGDPAPPPMERGTAAPTFRLITMAKRSPISANAELLFMVALCNRADHIYFHPVVCSLWSPNVNGQTIIFLPCDFYLLLLLFLA